MAQKRALAVEGEGGEAPEKRRSWRDVSKPFLSKDSRDGPTPFDRRNCSDELWNLFRWRSVNAITKQGCCSCLWIIPAMTHGPFF